MTKPRFYLCSAVFAVAALTACSGDKSTDEEKAEATAGTDDLPPLSDSVALPIVFVHGGAGSAQQYASQAIRFAANGYPRERIVAYDHDGAGFDVEQFLPGLEQVVDDTLERFDVEQVYLVGHSRGTILSTTYLSEPERAAKIAKYISLDGAPCPEAVPCIDPNQNTLTGQKHVEVATSKESFVEQYKFFVGEEPDVVDIVKQAGPVEISGRAVNFPANTALEGARLDVWEVDSATGKRSDDDPLATFDIAADGAFGPVTVDPDKRYELVLYTPDSGRYQHFYPQPYLRSSQLERLLSGPPDSEARKHTNSGDGHAALTVLRMREWLASDVLEISVDSKSGDMDAQNVITEENVFKDTMVGDRSVGEPIALYIHDDEATPGETTLDLLPWFPEQFFQSGIDVYMPAADPPDGVITIKNLPRGDSDKPQTLNVPNWSSTNHVVMVLFSDFPQE